MRSESGKEQTNFTQRRKGAKAVGEGAALLLCGFAVFASLHAVLLLFLGVLPAASQQIGQNVPIGGGETATIRVNTQLVVETVVVKDKKGNPIEGLTREGFYRHGKRRAPDRQFLRTPGIAAGSQRRLPHLRRPEEIKIYYRLGRTRITPEAPGNLRYKDRRLLALYFDMTAMPPADQLRALAAAEKFIRTQMTAG